MAEIVVIVPVYKVADCLRRCVDSLRVQDFRDFEVVLVDDGSPDGSGSLCDEYAGLDPRIKVVHKSNGGVSSARNAGLEYALSSSDARYLAFVDADDWIDASYLSTLFSGLREGVQVSAVGFVAEPMSEGGSVLATDGRWETLPAREFWKRQDVNPAVCWGKLFDRELFLGVRYPEGRINEDELINYQVLFKATGVAVNGAKLYHYVTREGSIMHAPWSEARLARLDAWRQQISYFEKLGYTELVAQARRFLVADCIDAIGRLSSIGGRRGMIGGLRQEIRQQLDALQSPVREWRMAYRAAYPVAFRLLGPLFMPWRR